MVQSYRNIEWRKQEGSIGLGRIPLAQTMKINERQPLERIIVPAPDIGARTIKVIIQTQVWRQFFPVPDSIRLRGL